MKRSPGRRFAHRLALAIGISINERRKAAEQNDGLE